MSDIVIQAEALGKKYLIGHQTERERYTALRDVLVRNVRDYWRKAKALAHGEPIVQGDEQEEIWALREVSFEIRQGEALGIIGRNGAGKSTLLKILSRITEPSAGRVTIKGRVASLLEVGTGFHPELTGRENIFLNGAILGMTRQEIKRKFDEIVDFAEVEKFLDTPVKRYSSGMYVRLAFAVAAHLEPEILVVDEVLAVGDAAFQKKCLGKMGDVAHEGRTVLFVSHNMVAIQSLCSRGILLETGQLKIDNKSSDVIAAYLLSQKNNKINKNEPLAISTSGDLELEDVVILNSHERELSSLVCGQVAIFKLNLRSKKIYKNTIVSIGIDNGFGTRVALLANILTGKSTLIKEGLSSVFCKISDFPLVPGQYTLSIKISTMTEVLIWAPSIISINVEAGDFFNSGKIITASWVGSVLIKHSWTSEELVL